MCGIFGIITNKESNISVKSFENAVKELLLLSESRGREAAGIALRYNNTIQILKAPISASQFVKSKPYYKLIKELTSKVSSSDGKINTPVAFIGHDRLVTDGYEDDNNNNQPVVKDGAIIIHNGIIVNANEIWEKDPELKQEYTVDTEVILALINKYRFDKGVVGALKKTFKDIYGAASIALVLNNIREIFLTTNNGSLYLILNKEAQICVFASEYYILNKFLQKKLLSILKVEDINQIAPNSGYSINNEEMSANHFFLDANEDFNIKEKKYEIPYKVVDYSRPIVKKDINLKIKNVELQYIRPSDIPLKRCNKCILTETMPFIEFDNNGVCNYCNNYKKINLFGKDQLDNKIQLFKEKKGRANCLVMFSGGRDSCYALHYVKKELGLNPIAYSYDWGMLTDLGRRNQSRLCGKLGVEHIIVSADIRKKRANIKKNVLAWLKKPDLGIIPLFMAGDKQFFYYANKIKKINNIDLVIQGSNPHEATDFKYGFSGVDLRFKNKKNKGLTLLNRYKLASYYLKQYLINPVYLNTSLFDTFTAYASYYFIPHDYLYLFHYINWNEETVNSTLINEYNWEIAKDTTTTWRIGDGTAAFYNYIYYTLAGFTENDTFRSNQIRRGIITREQALKRVENENKPREKSLRWYCRTVGIEYKNTIKRINNIPTLYE